MYSLFLETLYGSETMALRRKEKQIESFKLWRCKIKNLKLAHKVSNEDVLRRANEEIREISIFNWFYGNFNILQVLTSLLLLIINKLKNK